MTQKRRRRTVVAATVLSVAVFAVCGLSAAANVSGYERLKNAGFNTIENIEKYQGLYPNATMRISGVFYQDGIEVARGDGLHLTDGDKTLEFSRATSSIPEFSGYNDNETSVMYNDSFSYLRWYGDDGFNQGRNHYYVPEFHMSSQYKDDNTVIPPAQRRFIEAVADALVGDMRNYFVTDGNVVSISLSGGQIPEIAQFALAAISESAVEAIADGEDFPFALGLDAHFTDAFMEVMLDDQDNIIGVELALGMASTVDGETRTYGMSASYDISDVGTTKIETPLPSADAKPVPPDYFGQ